MSDETTHTEATPEAPATEAATVLPEVTDPATWKRRANARYRVKLPSGNVMEVRRTDLTRLLAEGVLLASDIQPQAEDGETKTVVELYWPAARKAVPFIAVNPRVVIPDGSPVPADVLDIDCDVARWDAVQLFLWAANMVATGLNAVEVME